MPLDTAFHSALKPLEDIVRSLHLFLLSPLTGFYCIASPVTRRHCGLCSNTPHLIIIKFHLYTFPVVTYERERLLTMYDLFAE